MALNRDAALTYLASRISEPDERGCRLWTGIVLHGSNGYDVAKVKLGGRMYTATRLQWELHRGPIADGAIICHHCDVSLCLNIEHHYEGTYKTNAEDRERRGRLVRVKGLDAPQTKLSPADIESIMSLFAGGTKQRQISRLYGVSAQLINNVVRAKGPYAKREDV